MTSPTSDTPPAPLDLCESCGMALDEFGLCDNTKCDAYDEPEDLDVEEEEEEEEEEIDLDDDEEEPVV